MRQTVLAFLIILATLSFHTLPASCNGAVSGITVGNVGPRGFTVSYTPSLLSVDSLSVDDSVYLQFLYDGHSYPDTAGSPNIPMTSLVFAVAAGTVPVAEIRTIGQSVMSGVIAPVARVVDASSGLAIERYEADPTDYALSGYQPHSFVRLEHLSEFSGVSLWRIVVSPLMFDAARSALSRCDSLDVMVSTPGLSDRMVVESRIPDYVINRSLFTTTQAAKRTIASSPFATGTWYRITVKESGMYAVSGNELEKAGFPVGSVSLDTIRMYYGGGKMLPALPHEITTDDFIEMAIMFRDVNNDGVLDSADRIVFYGQALSRFLINKRNIRPEFQNHSYSDENAYWLTISAEGIPSRIATFGETPSPSLEAQTTYRYIKHVEQENHLELDNAGIEWYWDAVSGQTKSYFIQAPGYVPGNTTDIRIGNINYYKLLKHHVDFYVNGTKFPSRFFPNFVKSSIDIEYNGDIKNDGFSIDMVRLDNYTGDYFHLDYIEAEFDRTLQFDGGDLEFFQAGDGLPHKYVVSGVPTVSVKIYDTTDPWKIRENDTALYSGSEKTLAFQTTIQNGTLSRFTLWDHNSYLRIASVERKEPSNLRNPESPANHIVISHSSFIEEAARLSDWRNRDSSIEPIISETVDVRSVYDEFAWGVYDPVAIRDYLKFVWEHTDTAKQVYCCLVGDTTYKYKNLTDAQRGMNFVPTYTNQDDIGTLTTDDYFSWFDPAFTPYPSVATGRLCVTSVKQAKSVIDKIIDYEQNPVPGEWQNRILLLADDELQENSEGHETTHSNQTQMLDVNNYIPKNIERTKLMMIEYPIENTMKPSVTEDIITNFHEGHVIANFFGHGNDDLLTHEHVLVGSRDIDRFNNGKKLPLFVVASCTVGNFILPDNISLAEMIHLREGGGCLAVIAASEKTHSTPNFTFVSSFYTHLFNRQENPEYRIGKALLRTKQQIPTDNSKRYILFGDPASRLMLPRYGFASADIDTLYRLEKVDIPMTVTTSDGAPVSYTGTVTVTARGPVIEKTYYTKNNIRHIDYTMPGKRFFIGDKLLTGSTFDAEFVVPIDVSSEGSDPRIYFFASGMNQAASGFIEDFTIGGQAPNTVTDTRSPEIELSFDGRAFGDRDYISRQPSLTASITDESGVNIVGTRGHNISILVDRNELILLTDSYRSYNNFTTGRIEYTLPVLSPGEHTLELSVYDTHNNQAKKQVTAMVVGSSTGNIEIIDLLNYPNPMGRNGTAFTFSLSDKASSAEIKIYSQAGRLVDSRRFNAGYGFNSYPWKPDFNIANGVYFYKLTVKSLTGRKASKIEKLVVMK